MSKEEIVSGAEKGELIVFKKKEGHYVKEKKLEGHSGGIRAIDFG